MYREISFLPIRNSDLGVGFNVLVAMKRTLNNNILKSKLILMIRLPEICWYQISERSWSRVGKTFNKITSRKRPFRWRRVMLPDVAVRTLEQNFRFFFLGTVFWHVSWKRRKCCTCCGTASGARAAHWVAGKHDLSMLLQIYPLLCVSYLGSLSSKYICMSFQHDLPILGHFLRLKFQLLTSDT